MPRNLAYASSRGTVSRAFATHSKVRQARAFANASGVVANLPAISHAANSGFDWNLIQKALLACGGVLLGAGVLSQNEASCSPLHEDREMVIFSGNANPELAVEIANLLNQRLGDITVARFADGEVRFNCSALLSSYPLAPLGHTSYRNCWNNDSSAIRLTFTKRRCPISHHTSLPC